MDDTLLRVGDLPDEHFTKAFLNQNVSEQKEQIHEFTKILKEEESSESEVRNTVIKFRRVCFFNISYEEIESLFFFSRILFLFFFLFSYYF